MNIVRGSKTRILRVNETKLHNIILYTLSGVKPVLALCSRSLTHSGKIRVVRSRGM